MKRKIEITADVDWDFDEGDTPPEREFKVSFTPEDLFHFGVLYGKYLGEEGWENEIDREALSEFLSDYLTDYTDFCHNGFTFTYSFK